jgi:hypothetical protein
MRPDELDAELVVHAAGAHGYFSANLSGTAAV